jgi:hypothetical protein
VLGWSSVAAAYSSGRTSATGSLNREAPTRFRHPVQDLVIHQPDGTARQSSGSQDPDGIAPDNLLLRDPTCALHFAFGRPEDYTNAIL